MYTFNEVIILFYIYAFLGWCMEITYAVLDTGKFINKGFLNGPVCPIYGFGMILILLVVAPFENNLFLLFVFSMLLTTLLEFVTGFVLEKIFNAKWWDYSDLPFNIKGYICLKFSIYWGIACTFVIKIIHILIYNLVNITPDVVIFILLIIFSVIMLTDVIITVCTILKLKKRLKIMGILETEIKDVSNNIGVMISEKVLYAKEINEDFREKIEDISEDIEEKISNKKKIIGRKTEKYILACKSKYNSLLSKKSIWQDRIINQLNWISNREIIEKIKKRG